MNELDRDTIKYIYDSGSIKILKLIKTTIHESNNIKQIEYAVSGMIKLIDKDMKKYEKENNIDEEERHGR